MTGPVKGKPIYGKLEVTWIDSILMWTVLVTTDLMIAIHERMKPDNIEMRRQFK